MNNKADTMNEFWDNNTLEEFACQLPTLVPYSTKKDWERLHAKHEDKLGAELLGEEGQETE